MPLYIVRWANLSASLVQAEDEDHLQELLDEVGDPGAAIWEEYDGPVWIEFEPDRRQTEAGEFELVDDFDATTGTYDVLKPSVADADTCLEMYETIMERLFPHLYVALRKTSGSNLPAEEVKVIINEALAREEWHGAACEERAQRYSDPNTIMGGAGLTVIPKHIGSAILEGLEDAKQAGRNIDTQVMALAAQQRDDITWQDGQYARLQAERESAFADHDLESMDDDFDE